MCLTSLNFQSRALCQESDWSCRLSARTSPVTTVRLWSQSADAQDFLFTPVVSQPTDPFAPELVWRSLPHSGGSIFTRNPQRQISGGKFPHLCLTIAQLGKNAGTGLTCFCPVWCFIISLQQIPWRGNWLKFTAELFWGRSKPPLIITQAGDRLT